MNEITITFEVKAEKWRLRTIKLFGYASIPLFIISKNFYALLLLAVARRLIKIRVIPDA